MQPRGVAPFSRAWALPGGPRRYNKQLSMNAARSDKKGAVGPPVLRFNVRLFRNGAVAKSGSSTLLSIPKPISKKLVGMTTLEGTINGHPFRAVLQGNDSEGYFMRVNDAMRRGAGADAGDTVELAILGPEPAPTPPADLRTALNASRAAKSLWNDLATLARRDYIRWIEGAKTPETRARRVRRTAEQLAEGKRRPCCVNVYEFMLERVRE